MTQKQYYKKIPYGSRLLVHCPKCEFEGEPAYRLGGHTRLNIVLFVLGIIPGIFYLIRRCTNCICLCKQCYNEELCEINGDTELIKKLQKIVRKQNICYRFIIFVFVLTIIDIIMRFF